VSRWYSPNNIDETGRMMCVAVAALLDEGISEPSDHLFLASTDNLATLIVSHAPFTAAELASLTATTEKRKFTVVARPQAPAASRALNEILAARTPETLTLLQTEYDFDLSPAYDDRPFFFQMARMNPQAVSNILKSEAGADIGVVKGNLKALATLALITGLSIALVLITILVPSLPSIRQTDPSVATFGSAYFLLIGLGFMFVEIGLIQRISVYLGHPVYGLAIGLLGIIVSTGIGSLLSGRVSLLHSGDCSLGPPFSAFISPRCPSGSPSSSTTSGRRLCRCARWFPFRRLSRPACLWALGFPPGCRSSTASTGARRRGSGQSTGRRECWRPGSPS
jgi:hypothetical protein